MWNYRYVTDGTDVQLCEVHYDQNDKPWAYADPDGDYAGVEAIREARSLPVLDTRTDFVGVCPFAE